MVVATRSVSVGTLASQLRLAKNLELRLGNSRIA